MFNSSELRDMQDVQSAHMMDECYILRWSEGTLDDFNLPSDPLYTPDKSPTPCGFGFGSSNHREVMQATQAPMTSTPLRLPIDTVLDHRDRIKVTKRFGVTEADPKTYSIVGYPKAGPSGLLVALEIVTDGSDE